ncbi:MAG TPA: hypothetical protein VFR18_01235 [Terriglobia bacterium]|nr:hypothetical protein [Terriglobia bacterium]
MIAIRHVPHGYNRRVQIEELRILLALESSWTISINGREFLHLRAADIGIEGSQLRFGRYSRTILEVEGLGASGVRVRARSRLRSRGDVLSFYAGEMLPSAAELRRRRSTFQRRLAIAVSRYLGKRVTRQTLHSDKQHGVGGAYPRLLVGSTGAVIGVDPDEATPIVNGIMRAAIQWAAVVKRRVTVVVPRDRSQTIVTRVMSLPRLREAFDWLAWDGIDLSPLPLSRGAETRVHPYVQLSVKSEVARILAIAPALLQAVPHIAAKAVSIRLRGLEIARVSETGVTYPLGENVESLIESLGQQRRHGSRHPLAHAHEEAWLESNLIARIRDVLPVRQDLIYPQVPSFEGDDRRVLDLLTVTDDGRLVVIEIKAAADPDLPFQAFDYWLAVERHRKAGDFEANGYFKRLRIRDEPALLVIVAPLLSFHKSVDRLLAILPPGLPLLQIGINQTWKRGIKVLRRKGALG